MKDTKDASNSNDLIIAVLSCSLAPIASRVISLLLDNNQWDTERLLVLYFAALSGFIIQDKIYRIIESERGYRMIRQLTSSYSLSFFIWLLPVSIVVLQYDDLTSILFLAAMNMAALIIAAKDYRSIQLNFKKMILVGLAMVLLVIASKYVFPPNKTNNTLLFLILLIAIQVVGCFCVNVVIIVIKYLMIRFRGNWK